jgi:hypothetical protein
MGFAIAYTTTEQISPALQREIIDSLKKHSAGRTWLSCEPPWLINQDGYLVGGSKPRDDFDRRDVASAKAEGLPDGTVNALLDCLCGVSAEFDIDWEISHDYSDSPVGYIRCGECDDEVRSLCQAFTDLGDDLRNLDVDPDDI